MSTVRGGAADEYPDSRDRGDLEGMSRAVRMGAEKVTVVIDRELP
jgi:hypothetical protein